ncbi:MAG: hypothetical protein QM783_12485 [Phycisphaerales bacterium]
MERAVAASGSLMRRAQHATEAPATPDQSEAAPSSPQSEPPNPQSQAQSRTALRRRLLEMPIEEFLKDAVAEAAAEFAARPPEPPSFIFATDYLVKNNHISHPQRADGTLQPLVEIPPGGIRPTKLECAVMAVSTANYQQHLFENRRAFLEARAAKAAREAEAKSRRRQRAPARDEPSRRG